MPYSAHKKSFLIRDVRTNTVVVLFLLFMGLINFRLFSIQVLQSDKYKTQASDQYWDFETTQAQRGDILSSDGFTLAGTQVVYRLYAEPQKVTNVSEAASSLAKIFSEISCKRTNLQERLEGENESDCDRNVKFSLYFNKYSQALGQNLLWVPLETDLSQSEKDIVAQANIPGLGFEDQHQRYYSEESLAAHVLGFVASNDKGESQGYYGIEGSLNDDLKGKDGKLTQERDATGAPILTGGFKEVEPIKGRNVVLTIDRAVQYIVEKKLKEGVEKYNALSGTAIIMDPYSGDVIAMANFPTYYPENFNLPAHAISDKDPRVNLEKRNIAVAETYEPGSVIKPLTIASAIDSNLVTPETTFDDPGYAVYSGYTIKNWNLQAYGTQNIIQLLQKSNNIGAAWVGHKVGSTKLYDYFKKFGIGTLSGIDLEGEDSGILRDPSDWRDIDLATISFGQGMSATPLQVINAFNVLANGGEYVKPRIIEKIIDDGKVTEIPVKTLRRVISTQTSDTITGLLEQAATGGEAQYFISKDYRVAGKTGTAQIPENGVYSPDRTNATFVGYLSGKKRVSILIMLKEPKTSIYAAETAAPLWMDIAYELVKFYGIAPDKPAVANIQPK